MRRLARLLLALSSALLLSAASHAKVTERLSKTYAFASDGVISLTNVNGDVEIEAWDRDEVSLEAEKTAADEEGLARLSIVIDHSPSRLAIKTEHGRSGWKFWNHRRSSSVRYKLMVPAGVSLRKVDVVNSEVRVRGVRGHVDIDSVNGAIEADGLAAGGRLDTVNGACTVVLPPDAAFTLDADTVNGRVSCDFPITISKSTRRHLKGTVNDGGATIVLDSVNGSLRIRKAKTTAD